MMYCATYTCVCWNRTRKHDIIAAAFLNNVCDWAMYAYHVWQNGTWMDDMVEAAAAAEDESVVVVGYHRDCSGFVAAKLDGEGALLWQWEGRHA